MLLRPSVLDRITLLEFALWDANLQQRLWLKWVDKKQPIDIDAVRHEDVPHA